MSDFDAKSLQWCEANEHRALPCPFCGSRLEIETDHHGAWLGHRSGDCFESVAQVHDAQDLTAWNTRHTQ